MKILVTGSSGFLAQRLVRQLSAQHDVIGISRNPPADSPATEIKGNFADAADLAQLDGHTIDAVVHLAAVTGGCSEADGMAVNVEGTRVLMKSLLEQGCKKFVLASTVAVVGVEDPEFRPESLPIEDEHPCFDKGGYGFSKYMMEEVARYYARQHPDVEVTALRLAGIMGSDEPEPPIDLRDMHPWLLACITRLTPNDAVRAFAMAVESPLKTGLRILNAVAPVVWSDVPTANHVRHWWPESPYDLEFCTGPGKECASLFAADRIREEIGYVAQDLPLFQTA